MRNRNCAPRIDWLMVGMALGLMLVGTALTLTWVGVIIGAPIFLASVQLLSESKTLRGTPCAP